MKTEETQKPTKLYFCDGFACQGGDNCYLSGGDCYHTTKKEHSLINKLRDIYDKQDIFLRIPTSFSNFAGGDVLVETIDQKVFLLNQQIHNSALIRAQLNNDKD